MDGSRSRSSSTSSVLVLETVDDDEDGGGPQRRMGCVRSVVVVATPEDERNQVCGRWKWKCPEAGRRSSINASNNDHNDHNDNVSVGVVVGVGDQDDGRRKTPILPVPRALHPRGRMNRVCTALCGVWRVSCIKFVSLYVYVYSVSSVSPLFPGLFFLCVFCQNI